MSDKSLTDNKPDKSPYVDNMEVVSSYAPPSTAGLLMFCYNKNYFRIPEF